VTVHVHPGDLVRLDQLVARVDADEADPPTDVPPVEADAAPAPPAAARR
jgi:acetyl-CoA/propionyl-CoA carboxylase biotin carboxyl carrier protein